MIVSKIEIKMQFTYVVQAQYEHRTVADAHLQYHCTVHKNNIALNVAKQLVQWDTHMTQSRIVMQSSLAGAFNKTLWLVSLEILNYKTKSSFHFQW